MSILLSAYQLSLTFAARPLFDGLTFAIEEGERIGLIGPNGAGKSSLLKILAGKQAQDSGTLSIQKGLNIAFLEQVPSFSPDATILSTILEGSHDPYDAKEQQKAHTYISKLSLEDSFLDEHTPIQQLSGGWKKRIAFTRELMKDPDLFLLDEPTNHLDLESIQEMESTLASARFATMTITHDRAFLQKVSNRIIELDKRHPDGLLSIKGDYLTFLEKKEDLLSAQEKQEVKLKNTLRRETEWLRQGAKARTTKQQARIQRAGELENIVGDLTERNKKLQVKLEFQGTDKAPKRLLEAENISKRFGDKLVIPNMSLVITPKSRLGILGKNGSGKSTLIQILLGKLQPDTGSIKPSEHLKISYFEQNRETLDPETSLAKTVCPHGEYVDHAGKKVHIRGYLDRFLFTPAQMEMPVGRLSGGEQSRVLIAKLMLTEANLLVLDEPTNDLDLPTLNVLQEVLEEFPGAVILVSHDRFFVDQVCDQILALDDGLNGKKEAHTFASTAQWSQWQQEKKSQKQKLKTPLSAPLPSESAQPSSTTKIKKKLSYKEQRELDSMEETILSKEDRLAFLSTESQKTENIANASKLLELTTEMASLEQEISRLYSRWQELES